MNIKSIFLFSIIISIMACASNHEILPGNFDKEQWRSSSHYRYEVTKTKEFFDLIRGKSKRETKKILGPPDFIHDGKFLYCLYIREKGDKKKCNGNVLILGFEKGSPYNITILME